MNAPATAWFVYLAIEQGMLAVVWWLVIGDWLERHPPYTSATLRMVPGERATRVASTAQTLREIAGQMVRYAPAMICVLMFAATFGWLFGNSVSSPDQPQASRREHQTEDIQRGATDARPTRPARDLEPDADSFLVGMVDPFTKSDECAANTQQQQSMPQVGGTREQGRASHEWHAQESQRPIPLVSGEPLLQVHGAASSRTIWIECSYSVAQQVAA